MRKYTTDLELGYEEHLVGFSTKATTDIPPGKVVMRVPGHLALTTFDDFYLKALIIEGTLDIDFLLQDKELVGNYYERISQVALAINILIHSAIQSDDFPDFAKFNIKDERMEFYDKSKPLAVTAHREQGARRRHASLAALRLVGVALHVGG